MILITGNARSGTSWLGKIFDSHPEVVYRHEPDTSRPCYDFPFFVETDEYSKHSVVAREYLAELCRVRTVRAVGRRPQFRKKYRSFSAALVRTSYLWFFLLLGQAPVIGRATDRANVPDMISAGHAPRYAVKSVISLGRSGLYARVLDNGYVVLLLRHPCGVVASQLRGMRLGKLERATPFQTISSSEIGRKYDLSVKYLESLSAEEQLAWVWVVMNEKAVSGVNGLDNSIIMTHEALCEDPTREARRLFEFCQLSWSSQTDAFLRPSESSGRATSYYDVNRNSADEIGKWKRELPLDVICRVEAILSRSPLSRFFG